VDEFGGKRKALILWWLQERTCCPSLSEDMAMTITVEAVYENGVLKPAQPLPLQEHAKVQVTVRVVASRVRQTAGLMGWTGSQDDADFVALSPELDPQEHA
jgi:predicted DNA-binding antitoxin AbrB/MazE fold protein